MLRSRNEQRRIAAWLAVRGILVGFLVIPGVWLAGPSRALAQDRPDARSVKEESPPAAPLAATPAAFNMARVPADAPLVIALRPAAMTKSEQVREVIDELAHEADGRRILDLVDPENIELIAFALIARDAPAVANHDDLHEWLLRSGALVVRTKKPREWKALAAALGVVSTPAKRENAEYFTLQIHDDVTIGYFLPDDRTLVVALEPTLVKLMSSEAKGAPAEGSPRSLLGKLTAGEAGIAVDLAWLRGLLGPVLGGDDVKEARLFSAPISPLFEDTQTLALGLDATKGVALELLAACGSADRADRVARTLEAVVTLAGNASDKVLRMLRREAPGDAGALVDTLTDLASQAVKSAKFERDGTTVRFRLSSQTDVVKSARTLLRNR